MKLETLNLLMAAAASLTKEMLNHAESDEDFILVCRALAERQALSPISAALLSDLVHASLDIRPNYAYKLKNSLQSDNDQFMVRMRNTLTVVNVIRNVTKFMKERNHDT